MTLDTRAPWPYGPGRPGVATTAAWLGFFLALLVGPAGFVGLTGLLTTGRAADLVLALGLPAAGGLVAGGLFLLRRVGRQLLFWSAIASGGLLLAAAVLDRDLRSDGWAGLVTTLLFFLPLPGVTAWLADRPEVAGWVSQGPPPLAGQLPCAPSPWGVPPERSEYGPPRPRAVTAAAVLGLVTAGGTLAFAPLVVGVNIAVPRLQAFGVVLLLGVPCAGWMLAGSLALLQRRSRGALVGAALAAAGVLVAALVVGLVTAPERWADQAPVVGLALPLPLLTAAFALRRPVTDWLAGRRH